MSFVRCLRLMALSLVAAVMLPSAAMAACTVTSKVTLNAGPYSPAAVAEGKVPMQTSRAGLGCTATVLNVLGGNAIRATFNTRNSLKLSNGSRQFAYTASADAGGSVAFTQGKTVDYTQNNLLNVLGLLGSSNAVLPLYITPGSAIGLPIGSYTDTITIDWNWQICSIAFVAGNCLGTLDRGTGSTDIVVTVEIGPRDMTIALTSTTTWDPVNGTTRPLALPGSKGRTSLTVSNPDLVALDGGSIALVYRVPARTSVALDGDGTIGGGTIRFADGSPASGNALSYVPGSSSDDVDFSSDNGASWGYQPVAGDRASEAAVTHLRFRPRNPMAAGGNFTLSFPYLVR